MMGYVCDIKSYLNTMYEKDLHEDFYRLTDALIESNQLEELACLMNVIRRYDKVCRMNFGLKQTNENLKRKTESLTSVLYGKK